MSRNHFNINSDSKITIKQILAYSEQTTMPINADIIIYVANKFIGYPLEFIEHLEDMLSDTIKQYPRWYLYSIGNKQILQPNGERILSGHYILISIQYIFKEPVLWYYSSQELSEPAKKEFKNFHDKFGVRILPETDVVTQSVFNLVGEPNSECGLWCLLFLQQYGKRPAADFVKSKFKQLKSLGKVSTSKSTKKIIQKDLKLNPSKILRNDLTLLNNKVIQKAIKLQKSYR